LHIPINLLSVLKLRVVADFLSRKLLESMSLTQNPLAEQENFME